MACDRVCEILQHIVPISLNEVPTGTQVFRLDGAERMEHS